MGTPDGRPPAAPALRVTAADGVEIAVHDLGAGPWGDAGHGGGGRREEPDAVPVVFAHATGMHGMVWQPLAAALGAHFHGVAVDGRGHGDSGRPAGLDFDWRGFGLDVLAAVEGLGLERPLGVGHSSGATAVLLAEEARPGTFRALYCYEPIVVASDPPLGRDASNWLAQGARRRREVFASRDEAYRHYAARAPFASWAPDAIAAYVRYGLADQEDGTVRLKCRGEHEALVYEMATAHDGYARLGRVTCPVALVYGSASDAVGRTSVELLAERLPKATIEELAGLGHFGPLEDPAAVAASITGFAGAL
jgi:pimeloyl-ACP methyl ester carboxylesterase